MRIAFLALLLTGCTITTEHLASTPPFEVRQSTKARDAVAECLLDRVSSDELLPKKEITEEATTVSFASRGWVKQPAVYVFVIRDLGAGSKTEIHRFAKASLASAGTCF